ncbi:Membrane lipoprotein [Liberibacter crescens BT-1]|uniref:Membrane lipoprotein n=1 Tax=Liberibacter crescens (strain BT-1) TaxID=1215343 RepID=L0EVX0_LIBCB|nr:ABC-type transport auxiliary lipoprotein family protein [Liberibacter crescens]AGA64823.1 Membrane lipoprotein [Liberibacter crescens BT-1]AMC12880.1 ABC transporter [Liberibacter crescens]
MKKYSSVLVTLTALLLSGCFGSSIKNTFDLSGDIKDVNHLKASQNILPRNNQQILIPEPTALKLLDSENIVVRSSDSEVQFLKNSQWSDRLPRMVQSKLIESFENSQKLGAVGKPGQGLAIDYQVISVIRAFEINVQLKRVIIEISIKLINDHNGLVKSQHIFHVESPLEGNSNNAFVNSLNKSFTKISSEIVNWTLLALSQ